MTETTQPVTTRDIKLKMGDTIMESYLLIDGKNFPATKITLVEDGLANRGTGKLFIEIPLYMIEILPKESKFAKK